LLTVQVTPAQRSAGFDDTQVPHATLQVCPLGQLLLEVHIPEAAPAAVVKAVGVDSPHAKSIVDSMDNVAVNFIKFFMI
jgi:hypothetical protein